MYRRFIDSLSFFYPILRCQQGTGAYLPQSRTVQKNHTCTIAGITVSQGYPQAGKHSGADRNSACGFAKLPF